MAVMTHEEAEEFVKHPIRPYDPVGQRNTFAFNHSYDDFVQYIKQELELLIGANISDIDSRRRLALLKSQYHEVRTKVDNYAYHTGIALLPPYRYALSLGYPSGKHPYDP